MLFFFFFSLSVTVTLTEGGCVYLSMCNVEIYLKREREGLTKSFHSSVVLAGRQLFFFLSFSRYTYKVHTQEKRKRLSVLLLPCGLLVRTALIYPARLILACKESSW